MPPTRAHLNGSVNLPDAETVMREVVTRIPAGLSRITDGETGDRNNWVFFQLDKFLQSPALEAAPAHDNPSEGYRQMPKVQLAAGFAPKDVQWPDLGYANAYRSSLDLFGRLRDEGVIPAGLRFQVEYPTPLASINAWVVPDQQDALLESYQQALFADLARFLAAVPHDQVAVQWDVAVEFAVLENSFTATSSQTFEPIVASLVQCIEQVPGDVPAGLHLCYGDAGHQHFKQPESLALQVRVLNEVAAAASRPVSFVSFTVPQDQHDAAYFTPLEQLRADHGTELYFALVPYYPETQGAGTTAEQIAHIDAALAASPAGARSWGVCTECGMGRAEQDKIAGLLDLHSAIMSTG